MDIKYLESFVMVSEQKSFTKAAKKLGYTQSTVSFQIKQLEEEFQAPLFERINHKISLSLSGEKFLPIAYDILRLYDEAGRINKDKKKPEGVVRLAIAESLAYDAFESFFASFHKEYPGISLKIISGSMAYMLSALNKNEVDILYTVDEQVFDNRYESVINTPVKMNFVCNAKHPLTKYGKISPKQLIEYPFLLTEKDLSYRKVFDEELLKLNLETLPLIEVGDTHLILQILKQGIGVSLLPDYVTRKDVNNGSLSILNVPGLEIKVFKQLYYLKNKYLTPEIKCVAAAIKESSAFKL